MLQVKKHYIAYNNDIDGEVITPIDLLLCKITTDWYFT